MFQTLQCLLLLCLVSQPFQTVCSQIYAEPYYDPTFKLVLRNKRVLAEFISVFTEIPHVTVIEFIDHYMNPLQAAGQARKFVNSVRFKALMRRVENLRSDQISVQLPKPRKRPRNPAPALQDEQPAASGSDSSSESIPVLEEVPVAAEFLHKCSHVFSDLKTCFPAPERNSQLDVICRISEKTIAMIEVQVVPENNWDKRALYYTSGVYFNQLRRGGTYEDLRKVISIQLLGTADSKSSPWKSTPDEFIRHYKFVDKDRAHEMDEIELFQICVPHLKNVRKDIDEQKATLWSEWIDFLKSAQDRNAEYVEALSSSNLKSAYASLKLDTMPKDVFERYMEEKKTNTRYSQFTSLKMEEMRNETIAEMSLKVEEVRSKTLAEVEAKNNKTLAEVEAKNNKTLAEVEAKNKKKLLESAQKLLHLLGDQEIATSLGLDLHEIQELRVSTRLKAGTVSAGCGELIFFTLWVSL
jgi:predicted transposase/invertase (TIGR01784 family)